MTRQERVCDLVDAALCGMQTVPDFTADEFVSASLTLALRTVQSTLQQHPECRGTMREAISAILMACADNKVTH